MRSGTFLLAALLALLAFGGGRDGANAGGLPLEGATTSVGGVELPTAVLPRDSFPLSPAQTQLAGSINGATLTETESCAGCHAEAAAEWQSSPHAFGSFNNPVYRVVVDQFRSDVGKDASRFCGGCHDAALLVDGAMSHEVAPTDSRAHGGVTCRVCHGIESTRPDGNGSYELASSPIPIPRDGDEASLRAHKERMALPPLRTAQMCGGCHRSFLSPETGNPAHLVGQDELGAWQQSAYAGAWLRASTNRSKRPNVGRATCRSKPLHGGMRQPRTGRFGRTASPVGTPGSRRCAVTGAARCGASGASARSEHRRCRGRG